MAEGKHPGGRPLKWPTPADLQKAVDEFFESDEIPTVMGLCLALDCDWTTLRDYGEKDEFSIIIARARRKILRHYELVGQGSQGKGGAHFADRMLTRMKVPAVEKTKLDATVTSLTDIAARMGVDGSHDDES